jgi:hypothetical protein
MNVVRRVVWHRAAATERGAAAAVGLQVRKGRTAACFTAQDDCAPHGINGDSRLTSAADPAGARLGLGAGCG